MTAAIGGALWGLPTVILLAVTSVFLSAGTGFFVLRHPLKMFRAAAMSLRRSGGSKDALSPFEALCTALAGTLGTGNMAGTAAAIALGGPGAVFWMMVCALFGMTTKAAECTLAVRFRVASGGGFSGGAMYYMRDGIGGIWRGAALIFALAMALCALGTTAIQPYTMAAALEDAFSVPRAATVTASVMLCAAVLFGRKKGAARFLSYLTPLLCALYIGGCVAALFKNRADVLPAAALIVTDAFSPRAAAAGGAGAAVRRAMSAGFSKSTFTHEAGMGAAPMVHAAAAAPHPAAQGMLGAVEVFVDTIVICMLTALVILTSDAAMSSPSPGIEMTMAAFSEALGVGGELLLAVSCVLFAFSTMVGWIFEFETSMRYLFGEHRVLYRVLYLSPALLVLGRDTEWVWQLVDCCTGIVVIPNVIALLLLSGEFFRLFQDYRRSGGLGR